MTATPVAVTRTPSTISAYHPGQPLKVVVAIILRIDRGLAEVGQPTRLMGGHQIAVGVIEIVGGLAHLDAARQLAVRQVAPSDLVVGIQTLLLLRGAPRLLALAVVVEVDSGFGPVLLILDLVYACSFASAFIASFCTHGFGWSQQGRDRRRCLPGATFA